MQLLSIPKERVDAIRRDRSISERVEKICKCKIKIGADDTIEVSGEALNEFSARNIIYAFGRGFDIETACKLLNDEYYFTSIDLGQMFGSEKRVMQIKARVIGINGKAKRYIEDVSQAKLSIYGDTISFIGTISGVEEAQTAVNTLIDGGTHRLAYTRMESSHRKNKSEALNPAF
jgi:ribosomal RNA assembly protein